LRDEKWRGKEGKDRTVKGRKGKGRSLGILRHGWKGNINMDIQLKECDGVK
jgi:hypothetical protein